MKLIVGKNDLATTHPELAKEADGWDPKTVFAGTGKKLRWICNKGHGWEASGTNRINGTGCPFCSHHKPLQGFNDLATTHPELAKEADGWDPNLTFRWTGKKLKWKCHKGHTWMATGGHRKNGTGCPICANKKVDRGFNDFATTHPEFLDQADGWDPTTVTAGSHQKLSWKCKKGHKWKTTGSEIIRGRGCPVCANKKIVVGVNDLATTHPELAKEADGWDPTTVTAGSHKKLLWKCASGHVWSTNVHSRASGASCLICSNHQLLVGVNDLATTHPELAKEADGWDPKTVIGGTGKSLSWQCSHGHKWKARGSSRINGSNCTVCVNRKVETGFNDLATTHPELAKEADGWDPKTETAGTNKILSWKCSIGHKWKTSGNHRINGRGCPSCAKTGFDPNQNGYVYFLIQPKWEIYQIGITNVPEDRLGRHKRNGFDLLELRGPMDGHTAKEIESSLIKFLKSQKADLSPDHVAGKFDGYSESWTMDSYKVNNLKELIDKASEAGF
jgi:hypothetical protein